MKYTFTKNPDPENEFDQTTVTFSGEAVSLERVLEDFRYFLFCSGFHFDGHIEIVNGSEDETP